MLASKAELRRARGFSVYSRHASSPRFMFSLREERVLREHQNEVEHIAIDCPLCRMDSWDMTHVQGRYAGLSRTQ